MPVDINGTTGVTTPGLASDSMPTSGGDAIVESGSNSDGDWTRWADGTQITRQVLSGSTPCTDAVGSLYRTGQIDAPQVIPFVGSFEASISSSSSVKTGDQYCWVGGVDSYSSLSFQLWRAQSAASLGFNVGIVATGRWK